MTKKDRMLAGRVPEELFSAIEDFKTANDMNTQQFLREAVAEYLDRHGRSGSRRSKTK